MKKIVLEKDYSIKVAAKVTNFITAENISLIIKPSYKLQTKNNLKVYKEQILFRNNEQKPIYSLISGTIIKHEDCIDCFNNKFHSLIIKNDYKEQIKNFQKTNIKTKEELLDCLEKKGITSYNNSQIYLFDLIKKLHEETILVINAFEDEPYIANKSMILKDYPEEILQTIDQIINLFNLNKAYILINNTQTDPIKKLMSRVGKYLNISLKLLNDYYGYGNNTILKSLTKNDDIVFLNIGDIIILHNLINKGKITTKKYITISGSLVKNPQVINVKIGTKLIDVLKQNITYDKNGNFIINGLMQGKLFKNIDNLVITSDFESLIITKIKNYPATKCLNCGLCGKICPKNIDPRKNNDNCFNCNLCNYICPAHIKLKEEKE